MSTRAVYAVIFAALVGSGILIALLPLGDACSFNDPPGVNCAAQSPLEQNLWNAAAILLPIVVGAGAALAAGSRHHIVGLVAAPLAILGAHFGARLLYRVEVPDYELLAVLGVLLVSAVLGLIGGHLSLHVAPRNPRVQRTREG